MLANAFLAVSVNSFNNSIGRLWKSQKLEKTVKTDNNQWKIHGFKTILRFCAKWG